MNLENDLKMADDLYLEASEFLAFSLKIFEEVKLTDKNYLNDIVNRLKTKYSDIIEVEVIGDSISGVQERGEVSQLNIKKLLMLQIGGFIYYLKEDFFYLIQKLDKRYLIIKSSKPRFVKTLLPTLLAYIGKVEQILSLHYSEEQIFATLMKALESRDNYTQGHSRRVADYSMIIANYYFPDFYDYIDWSKYKAPWNLLKINNADEFALQVEKAALVHDIGKIGLDAVLEKQGSLTDWEFMSLQTHPRESYKILSSIDRFKNEEIDRIALEHHEKCNGRGYIGKKGESIHIGARIISVADSYDAMTSDRPYRNGLKWYWALDDLRIKTLFDNEYDRNVFFAFELSLVDCLKEDKGLEYGIQMEFWKDEKYKFDMEYKEELKRFVDELGENYFNVEAYMTLYLSDDYSRLRIFSRKSGSMSIAMRGFYRLVCSNYYTNTILKDYFEYRKNNLTTLVFMNEITNPDLIEDIVTSLKHFKSPQKLIGHIYKKDEYDMFVIIVSQREDQDVFTLLKQIKTRFTAIVTEFNNEHPLTEDNYDKELKEAINVISNNNLSGILYGNDC